MIGEEVRQHRGIKQISFAAIALLLSLTVVALYQRSQAEAQRTIGRPAPPNPAINSRRRIFDPSRWIREPYHNYGCRERWFALVPMFAALRKSACGVRRGKAALSSGCKSHPATAPAGSNRSSRGGNEVAEAFG